MVLKEYNLKNINKVFREAHDTLIENLNKEKLSENDFDKINNDVVGNVRSTYTDIDEQMFYAEMMACVVAHLHRMRVE